LKINFSVACLGYLHLTVFQECPVGTYKNVTGSDRALCHDCPPHELPYRAIYIPVRGIFNNMLFSPHLNGRIKAKLFKSVLLLRRFSNNLILL